MASTKSDRKITPNPTFTCVHTSTLGHSPDPLQPPKFFVSFALWCSFLLRSDCFQGLQKSNIGLEKG